MKETVLFPYDLANLTIDTPILTKGIMVTLKHIHSKKGRATILLYSLSIDSQSRPSRGGGRESTMIGVWLPVHSSLEISNGGR